MSLPSPTAPFSSRKSYKYTFLSHDDTIRRVEPGSGENLTAEIASVGGEVSVNCAVAAVSKCAVFELFYRIELTGSHGMDQNNILISELNVNPNPLFHTDLFCDSYHLVVCSLHPACFLFSLDIIFCLSTPL